MNSKLSKSLNELRKLKHVSSVLAITDNFSEDTGYNWRELQQKMSQLRGNDDLLYLTLRNLCEKTAVS